MEMNDIVEGLNKYYETFHNRRVGHFVLRKVIENNVAVKSQKLYRIQIYFVGKKGPHVAVEANIHHRVVTDAEEAKVLSLLTTSITKSLLEYINTQDFKELCNDTNE